MYMLSPCLNFSKLNMFNSAIWNLPLIREQKLEPGTGNQRLERNARSLIWHKLHANVHEDTGKNTIVFWDFRKGGFMPAWTNFWNTTSTTWPIGKQWPSSGTATGCVHYFYKIWILLYSATSVKLLRHPLLHAINYKYPSAVKCGYCPLSLSFRTLRGITRKGEPKKDGALPIAPRGKG